MASFTEFCRKPNSSLVGSSLFRHAIRWHIKGIAAIFSPPIQGNGHTEGKGYFKHQIDEQMIANSGHKHSLQFRTLPSPVAMAVAAASLLLSLSIQATSYVWINSGGGTWSTGTNWAGGTAPVSASGATADFSQVGLNSNITVNMDTPVTVGNLIIGNTNTISGNTPNNWAFTDNGNIANRLTLAGGTSTITITNMGSGTNVVDFTTLSVAGTGGLTVNGGGTLETDVTNTYTGGTTVAGSTFIVGFSSAAGENESDTYTLGSSSVSAPTTLRVNKAGFNLLNPINLVTNAAGPIFLGNYRAQKADFFGDISLNGNDLVLTNGEDNTSNGKYLVSATVGGTGNVICINNSPAGNLTAGTLNNHGTVTLEGSSADPSAAFNVTFGANVTAINYAGPATVASFSVPANPGGLAINSSSAVNLTNLALVAGLSNLTVNANSSGAITIGTVPNGVKGFIENAGSGAGQVVIKAAVTGAAGISSVIQNSASSPLILTGINAYIAPTLVSNGLLMVNGTVVAGQSGSPITVFSGATLGGLGMVGNVVAIQAGGTLAPGPNDGYTTGTLTITNDGSAVTGGLLLNGNLFFKLNKGLAQSNDVVNMAGPNNTLTNLGTGILTVTNVGMPLATGDTFYLFSKPLIGGGNLTLVSASADFTNNLAVNGSISVVSAAPLPPAPVIMSVSPASGCTNGGTLITIIGANLSGGDTVTFGSAGGTGVVVNNSTNIAVTTPAGMAGTVDVTVMDIASQSSTLAHGFTYIVPPVLGVPAIVVTNMPAFGNFGPNCFLSGYVTNVNTVTNCVMVCDYWPNENPSPSHDAKLTPWGWFSRPTFDRFLTPIQPNGNWSCNMPSNFDQYATEYAVMVMPANTSQTAVNAPTGLPLADINNSEAILYADRVNTNRRAITWSGYNWWVKTAGADGNEFLGATGPGPNNYSASTNNVWIDAQGLLHLKIIHTGGVWECVQIWNFQTLGYGQYSCTLNANISNLDANVIFSMFTWSDDTDYADREIDMEVSRWDYNFGSSDVEDFAVAPYNNGQTLRFGLPGAITNSTHSFVWNNTNNVQFETYNGNYASPPASTNLLETWTCPTEPLPPQGGENVSLILWLYQGNPPLSGQPVEVTLSGFEFTPLADLTGVPYLLESTVTAQPTGIINGGTPSMAVSFSGAAGFSYTVERSTNLLTGWAPLWTTNAPASGVFNYSDTFKDLGGVPPPAAYYRLSRQQ
jgi:hypothetical protein